MRLLTEDGRERKEKVEVGDGRGCWGGLGGDDERKEGPSREEPSLGIGSSGMDRC